MMVHKIFWCDFISTAILGMVDSKFKVSFHVNVKSMLHDHMKYLNLRKTSSFLKVLIINDEKWTVYNVGYALSSGFLKLSDFWSSYSNNQFHSVMLPIGTVWIT